MGVLSLSSSTSRATGRACYTMAIISSSLVGVFALAAVVAALISYFSRIQVDAREPPVAHPNIPFIGHLIGLMREGPLYYARVRYVMLTCTILLGQLHELTVPQC